MDSTEFISRNYKSKSAALEASGGQNRVSLLELDEESSDRRLTDSGQFYPDGSDQVHGKVRRFNLTYLSIGEWRFCIEAE